ncbi:hypothetical protein B879_02755 [Cecembia lonarensis LW9]|uniref:Uncharacterized protein n=1 Tax=Cecembia lonarensis (strain CCUG 58316 / KCTC 22772 / LW9) TaxID=1225176 RepID=K1L8T6_CECL9|nr:hypothetical protein B879_02755 [Cecembia lonarensis LW9]
MFSLLRSISEGSRFNPYFFIERRYFDLNFLWNADTSASLSTSDAPACRTGRDLADFRARLNGTGRDFFMERRCTLMGRIIADSHQLRSAIICIIRVIRVLLYCELANNRCPSYLSVVNSCELREQTRDPSGEPANHPRSIR